MKKTISILLFMFISILSQAQTTKDEAFVELNKLLLNAKEQKYDDGNKKNAYKVSEQLFSEGVIIQRFKAKNYEMVTRYQKMPWPHLMDYYFQEVAGNKKIILFILMFKQDVDREMYTTSYKGSEVKGRPDVQVYVLEEDQAEIERLINIISLHFSKLK